MISPQATSFLTEDEERLKDFKLRLQVFERIFNFPLSEEEFFVSWFLCGEWEWLLPVSVSCARSHWIYQEVKGIPENCWNEGSLKLNHLKERKPSRSSSGKACRWDRWCESEADRSEDEREHPDDNQGLVPLTSHLQGRRHPLLQGGHLTGLWSNIYLGKLTFFIRSEARTRVGPEQRPVKNESRSLFTAPMKRAHRWSRENQVDQNTFFSF